MKVKLTKNEIVSIGNTIASLVGSGEKYPMAFSYFLSRNKRVLTEEIKDINDVVTEKLKNYRQELIDEKLVNDKGYVTDIEKFRQVEEKYKNEREEAEQFLSEELEIEMYGIKLNMIPDEVSAANFDQLYPLIFEPTAEELE